MVGYNQFYNLLLYSPIYLYYTTYYTIILYNLYNINENENLVRYKRNTYIINKILYIAAKNLICK